MGAWGAGILQNDDAYDAQSFMKEQFDKNGSLDEAIGAVLSDVALDQMHEPNRTFTFAGFLKGAWECGADVSRLRAKLQDFLLSANFEEIEGDVRVVRKLRTSLEALLISTTAPKEKPRRRKPPRKPVSPMFSRGDCLAIDLEDGHFGGVFINAVIQWTPVEIDYLIMFFDSLWTELPGLSDFDASSLVEEDFDLRGCLMHLPESEDPEDLYRYNETWGGKIVYVRSCDHRQFVRMRKRWTLVGRLPEEQPRLQAQEAFQQALSDIRFDRIVATLRARGAGA